MTPIETIELPNGFKLEVHYDPSPVNPREDENLGTFQVYSTRYPSPDDIVRDPPEILDDEIGIKVWAYAHSSVIYKAAPKNPFTCPWDSAFAGIIFCSKKKAREHLGLKRLTEKNVQDVLQILSDEVDTYTRYYNGEVYGYMVFDAEGECVDSCWGFYDEDYMIKEAKRNWE